MTTKATRVRLDRGGYASKGQPEAGRYYGVGDPVYRVTDDDLDPILLEYVRASTAKEAKAKALAARRPALIEQYTPSELERLCVYCGFKGTHHGTAENPQRPYACPAAAKFPRYPNTVRDPKKAEALFDKRLAKFWTKRKTSFRPVR